MRRVVLAESGCWIWTGATDGKGYGMIGGDGRTPIYTHRAAFIHYNGAIPAGYQIDHLCRVPLCCNPDHLEAVTPRENVLRGNKSARSLVCPEGHWILGDNVLLFTKQSGMVMRTCRACNIAKCARRYRERTAERRAID